MAERLAIAGTGAVACGLAAAAARSGPVTVWARSDASADRARARLASVCERLADVDAGLVRVTTELEALSEGTVVVEAVVEDTAAKLSLWERLREVVAADALLGSTTSSLSVQQLGEATGAPERFVALHVFTPVPKMALVELSYPRQALEATRARARALCEALDKTPVEVPDLPGFVVNRLLFPFLFSAVELLEQTGLAPESIDTCMQLGAGHPIGPLALLDYVGLDVAAAIGDAIGVEVPQRIRGLVADGALGKKSGRGIYVYN
jgi:3-hydroxybutyryl-CoA dehydrogenase